MKLFRLNVLAATLLGMFLYLTHDTSAQNVAVVKGVLTGYDSRSDKQFIELVMSDIIKPVTNRARLTDDGKFEFYLAINGEKEFFLKYDEKTLPIIIMAGDSLYFTISKREFLTSDGYTDYVAISGKCLKINHLILRHYLLIQVLTGNNSAFLDNSNSIEEFKSKRLKQLTENKNKLDSVFRKESVTDSKFVRWSFDQLDYAAGTDLCVKPFLGKMNNSLCDTSKYFDFLNSIKLANASAINNSAYHKFLDTYEACMEIICTLNLNYKEQRSKSLRADSVKSLFPFYFDLMKGKTTGVYKEYLLAILFKKCNGRIKIGKSYLDSIKRSVSSDHFSVVMNSSNNSKRTVWECIDEFDAPMNLKNQIRDFFTKVKGKTLYIDFWLKGCGPCYSEFSHYGELLSAVGKDVAFVFFGIHVTGQEMKAMAARYKLTGYSYPIDKNQIVFFEKYFNLNGFPHHSIVDPDGRIVFDDAPPVGDGRGIPKIVEILAKNSK